MNNKSLENRQNHIDLKRGFAMGIAGAAAGITVQLCSCPLGRSLSPIEDGWAVFNTVYIKTLDIFRIRKK